MLKVYNKVRKFLTGKEEGASMAEYALLLALITVALVLVIGLLGNAISNVFSDTASVIDGA